MNSTIWQTHREFYQPLHNTIFGVPPPNILFQTSILPLANKMNEKSTTKGIHTVCKRCNGDRTGVELRYCRHEMEKGKQFRSADEYKLFQSGV